MAHHSVKKRSSKSKSKPKSKRSKRSLPKTLKLWRKIATDHGFMIKGDFRKIPKVGSSAYKSLRKDYDSEKKRLGL